MFTALTFALWSYYGKDKELSGGQVFVVFVMLASCAFALTQDIALIKFLLKQ